MNNQIKFLQEQNRILSERIKIMQQAYDNLNKDFYELLERVK